MPIKNLFFSVLLVAGVLLTACNGFNKAQKSKDVNFKYQKANEYYEKGKYKKAQILYEMLFTDLRTDPRFEQLYYNYAYSFFNMKDYENSENMFKGYVEVYPNTERTEEMEYMRAYSLYLQSPKVHLDQTSTTKAMNMMQSFISNHPKSSRVAAATQVIDSGRLKIEQKELGEAKLFYNLGQYRAASIAYNNLLKAYPDSKSAEEYKLMSIKAYYKYAGESIVEKQVARYEKVIEDVLDFMDMYPNSTLQEQVLTYKKNSENKIKEIKNELNSSTKL